MRSLDRIGLAIFVVSLLLISWTFFEEDHRPIDVLESTEQHGSINQSTVNVTFPSSGNGPTEKPRCSAFLLIVVISAPRKVDYRSAIRHTWGRGLSPEDNAIFRVQRKYNNTTLVQTVFLLGESKDPETKDLVEKEAIYYGDVIVGSFMDTYKNLTMKTKFGLQWAAQQCHFQYFLKTDDDVFINIRGLLPWLWSLPRTNLYTGRCDFNKSVIRIKGHKW